MVLVFWHHAATNVEGAASSGMVGVSLFYILSGFVMAWTARSGDTARAFYRRRFARIYPAYIVAWLIALLALVSTGAMTVWDVVAPPTLLQAWVPAREVYYAGSAVFWSLSCEAFFYLVFPWLHRVLERLRTGGLVAVGVVAVAIGVGVPVAASAVEETPFTIGLLGVFPALRFMEFVVGVVIGMLFVRGWRPVVPVWVASAVAGAAVVAALWAPPFASRAAVTLIPFAVLVCALAAADIAGRPSVFRMPPLVTLGVWSYCCYLVHAVVLQLVFDLAALTPFAPAPEDVGVRIVLAVIALVLSVAAAWALHVTVERPWERRLRGATRATR